MVVHGQQVRLLSAVRNDYYCNEKLLILIGVERDFWRVELAGKFLQIPTRWIHQILLPDEVHLDLPTGQGTPLMLFPLT